MLRDKDRRSQNKEKQRHEQLEELRFGLEEAYSISLKDLAALIMKNGFCCQFCGECCTGDENSVVVFPFEIRRIMAFTGESWHNTAEPPAIGEWDCDGNFHTLEWRLKKEHGSCRFHGPQGCRVYEARPLLCSTYPFYLDRGELRCSECKGLGKSMGPLEAERIAALLKERSIVEIQEAIDLLQNYRDFQRGRPGKGACIVHDSEGEHKIDIDVRSS